MPKLLDWIRKLRSPEEPEIESGTAPMNLIQLRIQRAAESLLENEALTGELNDEAARLLLDWGIDRARAITETTVDMDEILAEETMYQPMRALRKMLRSVNKWVNDPQERELGKIIQQASIVYGRSPDEDAQEKFLSQVPGDIVGRVIALKQFLDG